MNTKQLINELNSECILTKLEKKEITELLQRGEAFEEIWEELMLYVEQTSEALTNKMLILWQKHISGKGGK